MNEVVPAIGIDRLNFSSEGSRDLFSKKENCLPDENTKIVVCCLEGENRSPELARTINGKVGYKKCIFLSGGLIGLSTYLDPDVDFSNINGPSYVKSKVNVQTGYTPATYYRDCIFQNQEIQHLYITLSNQELKGEEVKRAIRATKYMCDAYGKEIRTMNVNEAVKILGLSAADLTKKIISYFEGNIR